MATAQLGAILRHIRNLAADQLMSEQTDDALRRAFVSRNDQPAFEALLRRHGPMVSCASGKVDSSPVVGGERVYVGLSDGKLYVLNLEDGKRVRRIDLRGLISASSAVGGGCRVIGTEKNALFCLGAKK
jgi:hypothetical protein